MYQGNPVTVKQKARWYTTSLTRFRYTIEKASYFMLLR